MGGCSSNKQQIPQRLPLVFFVVPPGLTRSVTCLDEAATAAVTWTVGLA